MMYEEECLSPHPFLVGDVSVHTRERRRREEDRERDVCMRLID